MPYCGIIEEKNKTKLDSQSLMGKIIEILSKNFNLRLVFLNVNYYYLTNKTFTKVIPFMLHQKIYGER